MSILVLVLLIFSFVVLVTWLLHYALESDSPLPNRVYNSPWKYNYRYSIHVDSTGTALNVLLWRRYWNKKETKDSGAVKKDNVQEMYIDAHKVGQNLIKSRTVVIDRVKNLKSYGKKKTIFGKVASVCTKYSI